MRTWTNRCRPGRPENGARTQAKTLADSQAGVRNDFAPVASPSPPRCSPAWSGVQNQRRPQNPLLRHHAARQRGAMFKTRHARKIDFFATTLLASVERCSKPDTPAKSTFRHHAARQRGAMFKTRHARKIHFFASTLASSVMARRGSTRLGQNACGPSRSEGRLRGNSKKEPPGNRSAGGPHECTVPAPFKRRESVARRVRRSAAPGRIELRPADARCLAQACRIPPRSRQGASVSNARWENDFFSKADCVGGSRRSEAVLPCARGQFRPARQSDIIELLFLPDPCFVCNQESPAFRKRQAFQQACRRHRGTHCWGTNHDRA